MVIGNMREVWTCVLRCKRTDRHTVQTRSSQYFAPVVEEAGEK